MAEGFGFSWHVLGLLSPLRTPRSWLKQSLSAEFKLQRYKLPTRHQAARPTPPLASCGLQKEPFLGISDQVHQLAIYISCSKLACPQGCSRLDRQIPEVRDPPMSETGIRTQDWKLRANREQTQRSSLLVHKEKKSIIAKDSSVPKETNQTHNTCTYTYTYIKDAFNKSMFKKTNNKVASWVEYPHMKT